MLILGPHKAVLLCAWAPFYAISPYTTHNHMIVCCVSQAMKPPMHTTRFFEGQNQRIIDLPYLNLLNTIASWFLLSESQLTMFCW